MPEIVNQRLSITRPGGTSARVTIELDVDWDAWERRPGQEYLLRAEMWGEDGTIFDPDNRLFSFGFPFLTDGRAVQHLENTTLVPLRDLDEDSGRTKSMQFCASHRRARLAPHQQGPTP